MSIIQVFISLKITDNTARSALYALHQRMGMNMISQIKRWDVWELECSGTASGAERCVKDWVENTALFMNPNKHHYRMNSAAESVLTASMLPEQCRHDGAIFVYDREDGYGEAVLHTLQAKSCAAEPNLKVNKALHGVWWDIALQQPNSDSKKIIESLAYSTHRTSGLFANPHYQNARVFFSN